MVVGDLTTATEVLILGAGPGGYVAAIRAAQLGKEVTLVDPGPPGGTCLHDGCIPAKALLHAAAQLREIRGLEQMGIAVGGVELNFPRMQAWKQGLVERLTGGVERLLDGYKVQRVTGRGWFLSANEVRVEGEHGSTRYRFDAAIIATGAGPRPWPGLPIDNQRVLSPQQALRLPAVPPSVAVCGADYIAVELATLLAALGGHVTLLVPGAGLLPDYEVSAGRTVALRLKQSGVKVVIGAGPRTLTETGLRYATPDGEAEAEAACCITSAGVQPRTAGLGLEAAGVAVDKDGGVIVNEQMRTSAAHIYATGDVTGGIPLATVAIAQAKVAAEAVAGRPVAYQPQVVPRVVHSEPEVAAVGMTAEGARSEGHQVVTGRFPLGANGRALTLARSDGFALTVAEADSGLLLGMTLVGPRAGDLIGEAALAIEMGATLTDLADTLHAHPGLGEALQESAMGALGGAIHVLKGL